jgi:DNA-binding beta-propeller fold protein YncE
LGKTLPKFTAFVFLILVAASAGAAQTGGLAPIFEGTPREPKKARVVAEFPANTFLENIAVGGAGELFVTSLEEGAVYRIEPRTGVKTEFAKLNGKIAGIALDRNGGMLLTGWADGKTPSVFFVDRRGRLRATVAVEGAVFLNGITPLGGDKFLIADSYKGVIWAFDARSRRYEVWLADDALARGDATNPFPGVNGLRIHGGAVYATNTERQKVFRIKLLPGGKAGKPELFAERINGDDFAIDPAGNLYVTTHVYNSVVRVAPDGTTAVVAELGEGAAGATALAYGRGKGDRTDLYFVTNGGMSLPPPGGVQKAKVVRLTIDPE